MSCCDVDNGAGFAQSAVVSSVSLNFIGLSLPFPSSKGKIEPCSTNKSEESKYPLFSVNLLTLQLGRIICETS